VRRPEEQTACVQTYPVRVVDGVVHIEITEEEEMAA
jgi:hypothetical protein